MLATTRYYLGVDLGQTQDPTAFSLVERQDTVLDAVDPYSRERLTQSLYKVRGVKRVPLGTPYPAVVDIVYEQARSLPRDEKLTVVADATGVGAPVLDLLRARFRGSGTPVLGVVFTAGDTARYENGLYRVPKKDLIHGVMVLLQAEHLSIARSSPHANLLREELLNMRLKIGNDNHSAYEAWREGQHDDLVFSLALAVWKAKIEAGRPAQGTRPLF